MVFQREKSSQSFDLFKMLRDEKNRRFVSLTTERSA